MKRRQVLLTALGLAGALLLAFLLRGFVQRVIITPFAYLFWALGILYRSIPQPVIWLVVLVVMLFVVLNVFFSRPQQAPRPRHMPEATIGAVETLARLLAHKKIGVYFKWQIARTLSEIALDLQELREHNRSRQLKFPLGTNQEVQKYLDAGLNTSFADYPIPGGFPIPARFRKTPVTPFDTDLESVLRYLETQLESEDDRKRP